MNEWHLWDGETQHGPMDRSELENRIQHCPDPSIIRVWRSGFGDWRSVDEALKAELQDSSKPPSLPSLHQGTGNMKHRNFIARNWRGEYPLWVSYWIIGLLSYVFAFLIAALGTAFGSMVKGHYNPTLILLLLVLLWSSITGLTLWHQVGIWRSAGRKIRQQRAVGKYAPWAHLAKIMVCIGFLQLLGVLIRSALPQVSEATSMAFMDDPDIPPYSIRVMNGGSEAEITGGIKFGLTNDFEKILDASRGVHLVHLDSAGGRLGEGKKLSTLIKSRGLDTYVDSKCLSACTLAFVGGRQRILKTGAELGFHRGVFAGEDEVDSSLERSIYADAGVSGAFIDRAMSTKNADLWRPSQAELLQAGVVTSISNGDDYALGGFGGNKFTRDDWDNALQKTAPAYVALKERYPKSYNQILDVFSNGAERGTPQAELILSARIKMNELIKTLLPSAGDAVLVEFARLIVDQYRALQQRDATACYRFATGDSDQSLVDMIPQRLKERELQLDALIISSARPQGVRQNDERAWDKVHQGLNLRGYTASDLQILNAKSIQPVQYGRYCEIAISFYQEITNLSPKEAATILRGIFS